MAAGLGFKDFTTGEVLTAADVDGYLMQGIWVFASAAARDAAVTSPQEGNACYLKDTDVIQVYTGSSWAAQSASNPISGNIVDAKGDIIAATAADTVSRLAVGANDTVLTADSSTATGLKWAAPAAGGMTLISTTTLSGSSVSFTSIPQTYIHLQLIIEGYIPSTNAQSIFMRFNGNSSSNQHLNGGNPYSDVDNSVFNATEFQITADQSNSNTKSQITVNIPNYTNANTAKWAWSQSLTNQSVIADNRIDFRARMGFFLPVEAITSFSIRPFNPNFSGGTAYLYGVK